MQVICIPNQNRRWGEAANEPSPKPGWGEAPADPFNEEIHSLHSPYCKPKAKKLGRSLAPPLTSNHTKTELCVTRAHQRQRSPD